MLWLRRDRRLLWGPECLRMQGFPFHRIAHSRYSHQDFMTLSGNTFNGFAFAAFVMAVMCTVPFEPVEEGIQEESSESEYA